jgi:ABC-type Na+ efflux pump permease subunit
MTDHALSIPSPPPPLPQQRSRAAVVLLGLLVVVLAGASVLAIVLFVGAKDEHGLEVDRLDQTSRSLAEAEERLAETGTANDAVVGRISTLEAQNAELHKCADPARDSIIAARDDDDAALGPAVGLAADNC